MSNIAGGSSNGINSKAPSQRSLRAEINGNSNVIDRNNRPKMLQIRLKGQEDRILRPFSPGLELPLSHFPSVPPSPALTSWSSLSPSPSREQFFTHPVSGSVTTLDIHDYVHTNVSASGSMVMLLEDEDETRLKTTLPNQYREHSSTSSLGRQKAHESNSS